MSDYYLNGISTGRSKMHIFVCFLVVGLVLAIMNFCDPPNKSIIFNPSSSFDKLYTVNPND